MADMLHAGDANHNAAVGSRSVKKSRAQCATLGITLACTPGAVSSDGIVLLLPRALCKLLLPLDKILPRYATVMFLELWQSKTEL